MFYKKKQKCHIIMDIDGVLSPFYSLTKEDCFIVRSDWTTWVIRETVIDFLKFLIDKNDVVFIWASSWEEYSNDIFRALNVPEHRFLSFSDEDDSKQWNKVGPVREYIHQEVKKQDKVVWIDDDLTDNILDFYQNDSFLLVKPDPNVGLVDEDLGCIKVFVNDIN